MNTFRKFGMMVLLRTLFLYPGEEGIMRWDCGYILKFNLQDRALCSNTPMTSLKPVVIHREAD